MFYVDISRDMHWLRSGLAKSIQVWRNLIWGQSFKGTGRTEEPKKKNGMIKQPAGRHYHLQSGGTQDITRTQKPLGRLPSKAKPTGQELSGGTWNPGEGSRSQTRHLKRGEREEMMLKSPIGLCFSILFSSQENGVCRICPLWYRAEQYSGREWIWE